jgi:hypothetical protein
MPFRDRTPDELRAQAEKYRAQAASCAGVAAAKLLRLAAQYEALAALGENSRC